MEDLNMILNVSDLSDYTEQIQEYISNYEKRVLTYIFIYISHLIYFLL